MLRQTFNFGECNLKVMGNKFYTGDLTLDEVKDEQKEMQKRLMS